MKEIVEKQKALRQKYKTSPETALRIFEVQSINTAFNQQPLAKVVPANHKEVTFATDAHEFVGGKSETPCPGDLLLASLASCMEISLKIVAANLGIELTEVVVTAKGTIDARGPMMMSSEVPVGFQDIECSALVKAKEALSDEKKQQLIKATEKCCSIMSTIRSSNEVTAFVEISSSEK